MIRRVQPADTGGDIPARLTPDSEAALRILGRAAAYGTDKPFAPFWVREEQGQCPAGVVSLLDGQAVVWGGIDSELALFLSMNPEVRGIRCAGEDAAVFSAGEWDIKRGAVMMPGQHIHPPAMRPEALSPREAYPVLEQCFGDLGFEGWYADTSHRIRHGCCRIAGFSREGRGVSCAMTVAESPAGALIGAVATLPEGRGRGYGSACVLYLTEALVREGKRVMLSPKNPQAQALYEKIGFEVCGEWAELKRK